MKNQTRFLLAALVLIMACTTTTTNEPPAKETSKVSLSDVDNATIQSTIDTLKAKFGEASAPRIEKGVKQAAAFWSKADGTPQHFQAFCKHNFIASEAELDLMFKRISDNLESIFGSFHKINVDLKLPMDVDMGEILKIDEIFGSYSPAAHFTDDMFSDKVAFIVLLNFPHYTLAEKTTLGPGWTRKQWAYARLGEMFTSRTPGEINQKINDVLTASDFYISNYNIYLGNLRDDQGKKLFPDNLKLISHWGIRDELKADYNEPDGLAKQKLIYQVMLQIIRQDIPKEVINNAELVWNPYTNKVWKNDVEQKVVPEPDTRYQHLLNEFKEIRKADPYNPFNPDYISRKFDREMEIPEKDVEALFVNLISSPEIKLTGQLISKRLGRPLEPFDIWYDGFKSRSGISQSELDKVTKAKYPNKEAFQKDLPNILVKLGFPKDSAAFIASKITVDAARGSGHAWGAEMKSDNARLRTRIQKDGMDYKGYNIAIHEFGHTVEQTISLHNVDYYILKGVPNTAFTEALAFVFQKRDLELIGMEKKDPSAEYLNALDNLWSNYEIMGVSLVDMRVWRWLYAHPEATAPQLKQAVINIAIEVWNSYYEPVFGMKDSPILAIYSHMIDNPLYLPNYPIGHLIQFQIEQYMAGKDFGKEVYRIYSQGLLIPQLWMKDAVGNSISIEPDLKAAEAALKELNK